MSNQLLDIIRRQPIPEPWSEGEKIPWHEPGFSRRMLKEHLSQEHNAASRRLEIINQHIKWIHNHILSSQPGKILDLGCGPGLYTAGLSRLGHECTGIDYSPASIAHAREQAKAGRLECTYIEEDIRLAEYGTDYDLVILIFGEFNVFSPSDGKRILKKANSALKNNGLILLEPHPFSAIQKMGARNRWYTKQEGLFSDHPHLCLEESFWNEETRTTVERYFIVDAKSGAVTRYGSTLQAYMNREYEALLETCEFKEIRNYPSLTGEESGTQKDLTVLCAKKMERSGK